MERDRGAADHNSRPRASHPGTSWYYAIGTASQARPEGMPERGDARLDSYFSEPPPNAFSPRTLTLYFGL